MAARPLSITVENNTDAPVNFENANHQHGTQPKVSEGPNPIPVNQQAVVYAENTGMVGPQGSFSYTLQNGGGSFNFNYNHPYGSGTTYVNVTSPTGYASTMTINNLPHHNASCTISLIKTA